MYNDNQRGSDYASGATGTDYSSAPADRPILDRDIISGEYDRSAGMTQNTTSTPLPPETDDSNQVLPSKPARSNPVMPPERESR